MALAVALRDMFLVVIRSYAADEVASTINLVVSRGHLAIHCHL